MKKIDHNSLLAQASTIPSRLYFGADSLAREFEHIFPRAWGLVGRRSQLQKPGDFLTSKIGNEKILVVVNAKGELRGMFNVCRHRAGPIAVGEGNSPILRCRYHSWTYDLDGKLLGAPEFQGVENFDQNRCSLPAVQVRTFGPLVFGAIDPLMTFDEFLGTTAQDLADLNLEKMRFFKTKDYHVQANWKVYVDNFLEGYHLPSVHPDLCKELDYANYRVNTFAWYSTQDAPPKSTAKLYAGGERGGAHYYWFFPNLMFNIYQGMLQTNLVIPTGPEECVVRFDWYVKDEIYDEVVQKMPDLMKFSDQVQDEDAFICQQVMENLKSSSYSAGRYCVKRENGLHHFHSLLARMLND